MKYKLLILLTCHEAKDCVKDVIENIFKYNEDVVILINNGFYNETLSDLKSEHVHIVKRRFERGGHYYSLITNHVETWDYMVENGIQADYVVTMASNQCFIRHNLYDFMKNYKSGSNKRDLFKDKKITLANIHCNCVDQYCQQYLDDLGDENFIYQNNHDGMFYQWDLFSNMMKYFEDHRNRLVTHLSDEFLYSAYLVKYTTEEQVAHFDQYNYVIYPEATIEHVQSAINDGQYLVKRILRNYDDPARVFVRTLVDKDIK